MSTPQSYVRSISKLSDLLSSEVLLLSKHLYIPWVNSSDVTRQVPKTYSEFPNKRVSSDMYRLRKLVPTLMNGWVLVKS